MMVDGRASGKIHHGCPVKRVAFFREKVWARCGEEKKGEDWGDNGWESISFFQLFKCYINNIHHSQI